MQNGLLEILILGLFVVLFASIYRKRPSNVLRFWVAGWLLVELHFAVQMFHLASSFYRNLDDSVSISLLILSGVSFLFSASPIAASRWLGAITASLIGAPAIFYACYLGFGYSGHLPLYAASAVGVAGATSLALSVYRRRLKLLAFVTLALTAGEFWTFYAISHGRPQDGALAMVSELVLTYATFYWFDFRRFSAGVLTAVGGLVAWAAVFPVSDSCRHLTWCATIPGGLWNIPKYAVAFGMILTLLEEEIAAAGRASGHYRLLFVANPHPMWIHDPETLRFLRVNDAAVEHYGYSREEFMAMTLHDLRPSEDIEAILMETAKADSFTLSGPWRHRKKDGSEIQVDVAAHVIDFQGHSGRFVLVQDVTERQRLHAQLVHQAHHDSLTELPNRLLLEDRMRQAFAHAARHGRHAALICIDLDRFKQINDTFGHAVGDLCLRQVAMQITARLRVVDTVARTGGEEFVVVLGELGGPREPNWLRRISSRVFVSRLKPAAKPYTSPRLSESRCIRRMGRVQSIFGGLPIEPCTAQNNPGATNRSSYVLRSVPQPVRQTSLRNYMRRMLIEGGFELQYQPVYSMAGNLCGLEALLRLPHRRLGMLLPGRFIPIAEECGLEHLHSGCIGTNCPRRGRSIEEGTHSRYHHSTAGVKML